MQSNKMTYAICLQQDSTKVMVVERPNLAGQQPQDEQGEYGNQVT